MRHGRLRAIISMLAAVAAFSGMDALLKFFAATYPPMEVAVLRGAAALPFLLVPVLLFGRWQDLKPQRFAMHLARGALAVLVLGTFIYAVRALSLANAYAVFLSAPLIMTALSVPILKERTDRAGWLAISIGAHLGRPCRGRPRLVVRSRGRGGGAPLARHQLGAARVASGQARGPRSGPSVVRIARPPSSTRLRGSIGPTTGPRRG